MEKEVPSNIAMNNEREYKEMKAVLPGLWDYLWSHSFKFFSLENRAPIKTETSLSSRPVATFQLYHLQVSWLYASYLTSNGGNNTALRVKGEMS